MDEHEEQQGTIVLRIWVCGPLRLEWVDAASGRTLAPATTTIGGRDHAPALSLLGLLLCQPHRQAYRDWIMEQFWPESVRSVAVHRLENIFCCLRNVLRPPSGGESLLSSTRGKKNTGMLYSLAAYPQLWVDSDALSWNVEQAARMQRFGEDALPFWERAFSLLKRGPYLSDEPYALWAHERRELLNGYSRQCVHALCSLYLARQGEAGKAQALLLLRTYWQQHKTDEDALRPLMELLGEQERYQEAEEYYQHLLLALAELDPMEDRQPREPDPRTQDIREFLRARQIRRERTMANTLEAVKIPGPTPALSSPILSPQLISQGIVLAMQELEKQSMDTSRRTFLYLLGTVTALVGADTASPAFVTHFLRGHDHLFSFEQELALQWNFYQTGGTVQAYHGLHTFFSELKDFTDNAKGSLLHGRALTSLCLGYQLEGSLYRDMMKYDDAHTSYTQAFEVARELDDPELKAAALARRGVTYIQQNQPGEAILYLQEAYMLIEKMDLPFLVGYIFQALSEAYAIAQQPYESERNIELAQQSLEQRGKVLERSYCQANTTSVTAQKGVNAVHLHDYPSAMTLLEQGLANYNPSLVRGRARLKAQKAEADYGLGLIDACCQDATEAWILARSAGSNKTFTRLRNLQRALVLSPWKKEQQVIDLNWVMATL